MKPPLLNRLMRVVVFSVVAMIGALIAFTLVTSTPPPHVPVLAIPNPLATSTSPLHVAVLAIPGSISFRSAPNPNVQAQVQIVAGLLSATSLRYTNTRSDRSAGSTQGSGGCSRAGQWSVDVDPENIIGHPYAASPSMQNWIRAAQAIATAQTICPVSVSISWFEHDLHYPATDSWTALLSPTGAIGIDGSSLWRYALRHRRQV